MKKILLKLVFSLAILVLSIAGCGGGGGGGESNPGTVGTVSTLSGVAAVGAPLSGTVYLKDSSNPAKELSQALAADGSFSFDVTSLTAPFLLKVVGTSAGQNYTLYSFASAAGIANINPLSHMAVIQANGGLDPSALYASPNLQKLQAISAALPNIITGAKTKLSSLLSLYGAASVDFISGTYLANHQGLDKMLDMCPVTVSNGTVTITNKASGAIIFSSSLSGNTLNGQVNTNNLPGLYTVSGKVSTSNAVGIAGVKITATGADTTTVLTDANGNYTLSGLANGSYTLSAFLTGYTFSPLSLTVTVNGTNSTGKDFTGATTGGGNGNSNLPSWKWRNPLPQGNNLSSIANGNGIFVAVGDAGTILTSANGTTWTSRSSGTSANLSCVIYGNGKFVAVGDVATLTSADGITWSKSSDGAYGVAYGGGKFVAVNGDTTMTSADGTSWTKRTFDGWVCSVAYGGGTFVAIGDRTYINTQLSAYSSADGITWTKSSQTFGTLEFNPGNSLIYGGGKFVAVGGDTIITSINGSSWTFHFTDNPGFKSVTYGNGKFVAVGGGANGLGSVVTSTDAVTWTQLISSGTTTLNGVSYSSKFVAVGMAGTIATSTDGNTWVSRTSGTTMSTLKSVSYGNGKFVVVVGANNYDTVLGEDDNYLVSADGVAWTTARNPNGEQMYSVTYGSSRFVSVGQKGFGNYSSDGITWTNLPIPTQNDLYKVTYGGNKFVAVGKNGTILTSTDGITWTIRSSGTTSILNSVAYGNGKFVAVGNTGTKLTSADGITWAIVPDAVLAFNDITYGNGQFVAVKDTIFTSADGINWTDRRWSHVYCYGIIYGGGKYVVVGSEGSAAVSDDGVAWAGWTTGAGNALTSVTYGNGQFMAVGVNGTIITN